MEIHLDEVLMVQIPKVDYHLVGFTFNFNLHITRIRNSNFYFISIEFEHSLENETINHSHQLAMRKTAVISYKNPSYTNLPSLPINKQQNIESYLQSSIYDGKKSPLISTKKFLWSKSISKDG
jgi:hypothetical protein